MTFLNFLQILGTLFVHAYPLINWQNKLKDLLLAFKVGKKTYLSGPQFFRTRRLREKWSKIGNCQKT